MSKPKEKQVTITITLKDVLEAIITGLCALTLAFITSVIVWMIVTCIVE